MSLTNNHFTIILGIDIHFTMLPPFNPLHPFIGLVMDPMDYIPFIGATVQVNGRKRGVSDTSGMLVFLRHFPLFNGPFVETPFIAHQSVNFFGAQNTYAQGRRLSPTTYMKMTCNDIGIPLSMHPGANWKPMPSLFAPTSFSIPVPSGPPVNLGGPYVPDLMGAIINLLASYGFGALLKGAGKLLSKLGAKLEGKAAGKLATTMGKEEGKAKCKWDPVDMITGRVIYGGCDFELPGMLPLKWERNWFSDSRFTGLLGHGTTCQFDSQLHLMPEDDAIALLLPDGRATGFENLLPGQETYNRKEKITLTHHGDFYTATQHDSLLTYEYTRHPEKRDQYRLSAIRNEQGFEIGLTYTGTRLQYITDSAGRKLKIDTDAKERITQVTVLEKNGKEHVMVSYAYNEAGDLCTITDTLHQATRIVFEHHLMVKKTDRNGQSFYWKYDGQNHQARCVHTWGDGGLQEGFISYHKDHNIATNAAGQKTIYYFDERRLCTQITDAEGHHQFTDYTEFEEVYREVDEEGNVTGYRYDDRGNRIAIIQPDGAERTFTFDETGHLTMFADAAGNTTIRVWNKTGQLESVINADNGMTTYVYNEKKLLTAIRDNSNKTTRLQYDDACNLTDITMPDGSSTHWDYDGLGQCIRRINPQGGVQSFVYDQLGRPSRIQQPDGNIVWLEYNAYQEVIKAKDSTHEVLYAYTPMGSLLRRQENNTALQFQYNAEDELLSVTNAHQERFSWQRNSRGEVIRETGFDGGVRNYHRQGNGWIRKIDRPGGRFTAYEYNVNGQVVRAEYSDGTWEIFNYDKNGRMTEAVNEHVSAYFQRDSQGAVTQEKVITNGKAYTVNSVYNRLGQRTAITSNLGAGINLEYTAEGQVSNINARHNAGVEWQAGIRYNEMGLETERWLPGGVVSSFEYDRAGHPYRQTVRTAGRDSRKRQYTWNANDRLVSMLNEQTNGMVSYGHDDFGNLAWMENEDGKKTYRTPDATGNTYNSPQRNDRRYGPGGRLLWSDGDFYKYDDEGNLIEKSDGAGNIQQYEWYGNGLLKKVLRADGGVVSFEYDAIARRTAKIYQPAPGTGTITRWVWDGSTPLHEWQYGLEDKPVVQVDEMGNLQTSHAEPVSGLTTWVFKENSFMPAAKLTEASAQSIITDYHGTPVAMYDDKGIKTWEMELDIQGSPRMLKGNRTDCPFRFQGQYEDVETGLYYNRFRYYNPGEGLYISQDPIGFSSGEANFYAYVTDPLFYVDTLGLASGGSYGAVRGSNIGGQTNHMPANSATQNAGAGISHYSGPATHMETADHFQTASWGSRTTSKEWRAAQEDLINRGKYGKAMEMDIRDVKRKFGNKYDQGMKEMLDYAHEKGYITNAEKNRLKRKYSGCH